MSAERSAKPYVFDARSAGWPRTTGWERYTREIARRMSITDPCVEVRIAGSPALKSRLWQDAVATPLAIRQSRVAHFPSMPPVPWARTRGSVVYTLHDLTWWRWSTTASRMGRRYYAPLARLAALGRAHIVVDTQAVADEVLGYFELESSSVTVVPLGVELPAPSAESRRTRPYLLTVATLEPRKNLARLAVAYSRSGLAATHDLVVVGRFGWGDPPPGLEIVSGLDDAALASTYAAAAALVMPSLYEGFGLPAVEAMQMGIPVLCSDIPVLREVTGGYAEYVDATDTDALAQALREVPSMTVPAAAAPWAATTYRWELTVAALSALYRRLDDDHCDTGKGAAARVT